MPKASTSKTPPSKPYLPRISPSTASSRSKKSMGGLEDNTIAADSDATATPATNGSPAPRRWTNDEYVDLFRYVAGTAGNFENAVPGRTRNQCYQAWRCVVQPFIINALSTKDGGTARPIPAATAKPRKASKNGIKIEEDVKPDVNEKSA